MTQIPESTNTKSEWLERFDELVRDHLSDSGLTNERLAAQMSFSRGKLYRLVRKTTGQSPNHYIRNMRLQRAYELLETNRYLTVKEVAAKVGFKKAAYFTRLFKEKFGALPVEVLRNPRGK